MGCAIVQPAEDFIKNLVIHLPALHIPSLLLLRTTHREKGAKFRLHRRQRFVEYDNPCDYNDREGNEPSPQRRDVEVVLRTALCVSG